MGQPPLSSNFPRPPREVRRRHGGGNAVLMRVLSVALLVVCFILAGRVARDALVHCAGENVSARVMRTWTTRGKRTHYHVAYSYVADGGQFFDDETISRDQFQRFTVGQPLRAQSLKIFGQRSAALVRGSKDWWGHQGMFAVMGVIWAGICGWLFRVAWIDPSRDRRALQDGEPVSGEVTDKRTRRTKNGHTYHVRFRYTPRLGEAQEREVRTARFIFDAVALSDPLTVFIDPAKPRRGVPMELCEFEIVRW